MTGTPPRGTSTPALESHPRRDELRSRMTECDADGNPRWEVRRRDEPEDWTALWLEATDVQETRDNIRITCRPRSWEESEMADARMRAGESSDD
jgi:hypothetical protein